MEVVRCSRSAVVAEIVRLKNMLSAVPEKKNCVPMLEKAERIFSASVDRDGLAIRCDSSEITTLVDEYLRMLSKKHHLAICSFVEKGVSVYSVKQIRRLKEYSVFSVTLPYNSADSKIAIFVCYYDTYKGEVYDIDLMSKKFCS